MVLEKPGNDLCLHAFEVRVIQAALNFDVPAVTVPSADTQKGMLLRAMQRGERLTIWNAMMDYGCGALHQRMKELRDDGWPVKRQEITVNGKRVAEFWMES